MPCHPRVHASGLLGWNRKLWQDGERAEPSVKCDAISFIEAAMLEQGYQASEVASFLGCHGSNVSRALQKRGSKI
jgi:hypothetical protein